MDSEAILARVNARYSHAATYNDSGVVDDSRDLTGRIFSWVFNGPSHDTFSTSFKRPYLRFVYHSNYRMDRAAEGIPGDNDFELALSGLRGISHCAADFPLGLLSSKASPRPFAAMKDIKLLGSADVHHRRCYVISGRDRAYKYQIFIDAETFVLLRVFVTSPANADYAVTIDYWPVLG